MTKEQVRDYFSQLEAYTKDVYAYLKIPFDAKGKKNWRNWDKPTGPEGLIIHHTVSNSAVTKIRPLGRIPTMLRRFALNSGPPGIHFIAWDNKNPALDSIRSKYPVFNELPCDVFHYGFDKAFYHGNTANGWACGIENRNIGRLIEKAGKFYWDKMVPYVGRPPVQVRGFWCEPFTLEQVKTNIILLRWMGAIYDTKPEKVLGHIHVISNRTDPYPHFPLALVRDSCFGASSATNVDDLSWLRKYSTDPDFYVRQDEWLKEDIIEEEDDSIETEDAGSFIDVEKLYGINKIVDFNDIREVLTGLEQLGYYITGINENDPTAIWALQVFQRRWVYKVGVKWVNSMRITGKIDPATVQKLNKMLHDLRYI